MTKSERELWQQYQDSFAQKKNLEDFLQNFHKPDDLQKDALNAYDDIVSAVKSKIFTLMSAVARLKKSVADIENKLETPDCKKKYFARFSSNSSIQSSRKKNAQTCK